MFMRYRSDFGGNSYIDISNLQYYNNDNTLMRRVGRET